MNSTDIVNDKHLLIYIPFNPKVQGQDIKIDIGTYTHFAVIALIVERRYFMFPSFGLLAILNFRKIVARAFNRTILTRFFCDNPYPNATSSTSSGHGYNSRNLSGRNYE